MIRCWQSLYTIAFTAVAEAALSATVALAKFSIAVRLVAAVMIVSVAQEDARVCPQECMRVIGSEYT